MDLKRLALLAILAVGALCHFYVLSTLVTAPYVKKETILYGFTMDFISGQATITSVTEGLPAQRADLQANDRIITLNDQPVFSIENLYKLKESGDSLRVTIVRNGQTLRRQIVPLLIPNTRFNFVAKIIYYYQWLYIPLQIYLLLILWRQPAFPLQRRTDLLAFGGFLAAVLPSPIFQGFVGIWPRLFFGIMIGSQIIAITLFMIRLGADVNKEKQYNIFLSGLYGQIFAAIGIFIQMAALPGDKAFFAICSLPLFGLVQGTTFMFLANIIHKHLLLRIAPRQEENALARVIILSFCFAATFCVLFYVQFGENSDFSGILRPVIFSTMGFFIPFVIFLIVYDRMQKRVEKSYQQLKEQEWLLREMDMARAIQQRLLPHCPGNLPGLESCTFSKPAIEVGGDFYDIIDLGGGRTGICVGDVSGKGLSAAFYMARVTGMVRVLAHTIADPGELLRHLHNYLKPDLEKHVFITMIYIIYDANTRILQVARAGHGSLPVFLAQTQQVELMEPRGPGIGVPILLPGFTVATKLLQIGDTLFFYTDGISEAMSPTQDEFGEDRLAQAIERHISGGSVAEIRNRILQEVSAFVGTAPQHDDMTLLIFRAVDNRPQQSSCAKSK